MRDELKGKVEVGDIVVLASSRSQHPTLARVRKVWKNGVIEIGNLDSGATHRGRLFNPDGFERGGVMGHRNHIRLLKEGETAESLLAGKKAADEKAKVEQEHGKQKKKRTVAEWWQAEGHAMWDGRIVLPQRMLGLVEVAVVRFTRYDEDHMSFVVVESAKGWNGQPTIQLTTGGLAGRDYSGRHSINPYSSSAIIGDTLEEALYCMTH